MSETGKKRKRRLAWELTGFFCVSAAAAAVFHVLIYRAAVTIAGNYIRYRGWQLTEAWETAGRLWLRNLCFAGAGLIFFWLFFLLLTRKVSYILRIIRGIEAMETREMDFSIPVEGNDELTELAERMNRLALSQRQLRAREREMREERERFIRSMSHDIRNPLAAILARSEYMRGKAEWEPDEIREYIGSVSDRAGQIKELTDRLLDTKARKLERITDGRLLMEQMAGEWEACLEERFSCRVSLAECREFEWTVDPGEIRRIFDNLMTNIERYGDRDVPVNLEIRTEDGALCLIQDNGAAKGAEPETASRGLGIAGIRQIADLYQGSVGLRRTPDRFQIEIILKGIHIL